MSYCDWIDVIYVAVILLLNTPIDTGACLHLARANSFNNNDFVFKRQQILIEEKHFVS